jgi:hypothetical protein
VNAAEHVLRFDVASIGRPERTPQGFLRVPAYLTRAGVFAYRRADGSTVRELRPPEEVFAPASLATLAAAPVTDLHPSEPVTPKNVRALAIGHVSERVTQDGSMVSASLTVQDEAAIAKVEKRERCEISMGYRCRIDATPGQHEGEPYDCVQRDIVYNHAALGPRNWGRAGRDVALRLDADPGAAAPAADDLAQVFRLDASAALLMDEPPERRADDDDPNATNHPPGGQPKMDLTTIRVDGLEVQVPKQWQQLIERALATRDDNLKTLTGARDALQGKHDALEAEFAATKAKLIEASDPRRLDAAVNERAALLEQARKVLPAETKYDGLTPRQIQEAVLVHLDAKLELKGRSDEYVAARFDGAIAAVSPTDPRPGTLRSDALDDARRHTAPGARPAERRQDAAPYVPPWQMPLATSKDRRSS